MSRATIAVVGITFILAVVLIVFRSRHRPAEQSVATMPPAVEVPTASTPAVQAPAASAEIQDLKARLAKERGARERAEAEAAALRQQAAPLQSNVVISLGKVEDIGKRAGTLLPALGELQTLGSRDPNTLSAEEKRHLLQLQREHAVLLGALPEITGFQDHPDDYARFFRSMLQQAAGLTDPQATQVEDYMRRRAVEMNQLGLNAAKEPTDPKLEEAWEGRRDQFNEQTANGLKGILPPGAAEKAGIGSELMEFLEMDFDKINKSPPDKKTQ